MIEHESARLLAAEALALKVTQGRKISEFLVDFAFLSYLLLFSLWRQESYAFSMLILTSTDRPSIFHRMSILILLFLIVKTTVPIGLSSQHDRLTIVTSKQAQGLSDDATTHVSRMALFLFPFFPPIRLSLALLIFQSSFSPSPFLFLFLLFPRTLSGYKLLVPEVIGFCEDLTVPYTCRHVCTSISQGWILFLKHNLWTYIFFNSDVRIIFL